MKECIYKKDDIPFDLLEYFEKAEIGLEETPEAYIAKLSDVFMEVYRVLKPEGTLWLNIGDSYYNYRPGSGAMCKQTVSNTIQDLPQHCSRRANKIDGVKEKDLIGIPWMLAFELRKRGWYLRQDIIWQKPNPMPESVTDRCTKSHEYIFLLSKSQKYYFDHEAIQEKAKYPFDNRGERGDSRRGTQMNSMSGQTGEMRNKRDVWEVNTKPCKEAHFATYPFELIKPCILAGCPENGIVLDPFMGSGTTAIVARSLNRNYLGVELNPEYIKIAHKRLEKHLGMFQ